MVNQRIVTRLGGQYVANTLPIRLFFGTVPQARESHDELHRQFWMLVVVNVIAAVAIGVCVYAFHSMVH